MRMGITFRKWWALPAFILLLLLGLAACTGEDSLPRTAPTPLTPPPPATRAEPASPSTTATPAEPEQPTYTPTAPPTAESKPAAPNATATPARPVQPTYTPRPPPTVRPRPADPNPTATPAGSEQPAATPGREPVLSRPEYDVSVAFSDLIKPYFLAQDADGNPVAAGGEPELILDYQGSIKIKLDDDGEARYLDLLALESEQIGEHPVHKIFRLEAMGVVVAPDVDRKIQPDSFDPSLFHSIDFEYQRGREASGIIAELFHDGSFLVITHGTPAEWKSSRPVEIAAPTHFHVNPRALSVPTSQLAQEYESEILTLSFDDQRYPPPRLARKQCDLYQESLDYGPYRELLNSLGFYFTISEEPGDDEPGDSSGGTPHFGQRYANLIRRGAGDDTRYFGMDSQWLGELLRELDAPWIGECDNAGGARSYQSLDDSEDRYYLILRRSLEPDKQQRYKIISLSEDGAGEEVYTAPGAMLMALPVPWDDRRWIISTEGWPAAEGDRPADPRWQSVYIVNTENPEEYQLVEYPLSQFPNAPEAGLYGASAAVSADGRYLNNTLYGFKDEGGGLWVAALEAGFHSNPDSFIRIVEWDHMLSWISLAGDNDSPEPAESRAIFVTGKEVADDFAMTANVIRLKGAGLETGIESKERLLQMVGWNPVPFAMQTLSDGRIRVAVETHLNYESSLLPRAKGVYLLNVDAGNPD